MEPKSDINETKPEQTPAIKQEAKIEASQDVSQKIDYDTFRKVEMRVATVLEAESVQGTNKLIKLILDLGTEKRQLVAGIAKSYAPADLIGKQVVVVTNLQPRKLMGVESNGMILAAGETAENIVLLTIDRKVDNGLQVK
jgi:methionyl-tRNA synthetase